MGLDMYLITTTAKPEADVDVDVELMAASDLHTWRKHPNLHGWMHCLYIAKGGADPDFNCATLVLTADDLDRLEATIRERRLPPTEGFFFGHSDGSEVEDDLAAIAKARAAIAGGATVVYHAWW